jgi:hypothetical protein
MRYLASLALLSISIQTWAEIPGGAMLVEREVAGGNVPEEYRGYASKVGVGADGGIYHVYHKNDRETWKTEKVATLSDAKLKSLMAELAKVAAGEIKYPDSPECTDLPVTSYNITRNNTTFAFAKNLNCRLGTVAEDGTIFHLISILDGFEALSALP